jgi:hypothetical protein
MALNNKPNPTPESDAPRNHILNNEETIETWVNAGPGKFEDVVRGARFGGKINPHWKEADQLRLSNHHYGMIFELKVQNRHATVLGYRYWYRAVKSEYLKFLLTNPHRYEDGRYVIHLDGSSPFIPDSPSVPMTLTLCKKKNAFHLDEVDIEFSKEYWQKWFERICGEDAEVERVAAARIAGSTF